MSAPAHSHSQRPRRRSRFVPVLLVGALALTACGSDADSAGGQQDVADPVATPVTLHVLMADDWAPTAPVQDVIRAFEASHPGVQIDIEGLPFSQIIESVRSGQQAGEVPDVVQWHPFAAGAQGVAEVVDDLWAEHLDESEFVPGAIEDVVWGGRKYGVPLDTNALFLLVNPALADEAGLEGDAPTTFDEFRAWSQAVAELGDDHRGIALPLSSWSTFGWMVANGGTLLRFDDDGSPVITIDSPENIEALDFLGQLADEGLAYEPSRAHESQDSFELFRNQFTAMHATGSWDMSALAAEVGWEPVPVPMPLGAGATTAGTVLGGSGLFIPLGSEHRDLGFELMMALIDDATALRLAQEEGRLPVRTRVFADPFFDQPGLQVVTEALPGARVMNLVAYQDAIDAFSRAIEDVLAGRSDAATALAEVQRIAEQEAGAA